MGGVALHREVLVDRKVQHEPTTKRDRNGAHDMKLTTTDDQSLTYLRILVHGDSGIGKTTSLRTLKPEADKTIICVSERGTVPLRKHKFRCLPLDCWDDARVIIGYFRTIGKGEPNDAIQNAVNVCKILVIDGLSELHDQCVRNIVEVDKKALAAARGKGKADKNYEDQMGLEDWGLYKSRMLNMISAFCHLSVHVIFTSLSAWSKDKEGGDTYRTPGLSGKAALECPRFFDLVLHMEAAKDSDGKHTCVWRTFNDGRIIAKDATGDLAPFEPADWMTVFGKILGTKNGSKK
jgi:hypothetical protein